MFVLRSPKIKSRWTRNISTASSGTCLANRLCQISFGSREVLHDLSMQVKRGTIFLGPNGSGKTTTIWRASRVYEVFT
jgi:ABC-type branched-subunit amino acid transport system ATPase component